MIQTCGELDLAKKTLAAERLSQIGTKDFERDIDGRACGRARGRRWPFRPRRVDGRVGIDGQRTGERRRSRRVGRVH